MKRLPIIASLAIVASLFTAAPAAAWHVETGDCASDVRGAIFEPYGDPWGRIVVRNDRTCWGFVRVPDERWVGDGILTVREAGSSDAVGFAARGERIYLRPGDYVGTWSNSQEVEHFAIYNEAGPVTVGWSFVGRQGKTVKVYTVPAGCVLRSGYQWLEGRTVTKLRDRTNRRLLPAMAGQQTRLRTAAPGWYKPLVRDYARGLTCKV